MTSSPFASKSSYWAIKFGDYVMQSVEHALQPLGLTSREYNVMTCILGKPGVSQQELSRCLGLYATGLVGLIDRLESRKLLHRERNATDRRRYGLLLSSEGKELLSGADTRVELTERHIFRCVSAEEKAALNELIARVLQAQDS